MSSPDHRLFAKMYQEFRDELDIADRQRDIASLHDGYGLLLEELDEFWEEVKKKPAGRDPENMARELMQIMAVCWRIRRDVVEAQLSRRM